MEEGNVAECVFDRQVGNRNRTRQEKSSADVCEKLPSRFREIFLLRTNRAGEDVGIYSSLASEFDHGCLEDFTIISPGIGSKISEQCISREGGHVIGK